MKECINCNTKWDVKTRENFVLCPSNGFLNLSQNILVCPSCKPVHRDLVINEHASNAKILLHITDQLKKFYNIQ